VGSGPASRKMDNVVASEDLQQGERRMVEAKDIELGDEPIAVQRRPRSGLVVSTRLSPEEADRLQDLAEAQGKTVSQVAREALTIYVNAGGTRVPQLSWAAWTGTVGGPAILELTFSDHSRVVRTRADQVLQPVLSP
jgi:hypothetical protein